MIPFDRPDFAILDQIDYAIFGNLCIARVDGQIVVALLDGVCVANTKQKVERPKRTS